jgi:hypothetical protein
MTKMFKQKPFYFSLVALIILITLHAVGSYYSWYWVYSWFDVVVHIVSGLWVSLVMLWLASVLGQINSLKEYKVKSFLIAFLSAVLFGVVWEIFENISQTTFTNASGYSLNTAMDILNDGLGGVLAYLYFIRRRKCVDKSTDILHPFYNQTGIIKS